MDDSKSRSSYQGLEKPPVYISSPYVSLVDVEKIDFRKLCKDIQLHLDVGLKLYKVQRSANDATFYVIFVKLKDYLEEAQKHQEYLLAGVSK